MGKELENVIRAQPIFRDYTLAQRAAAVQGQPAPGVDPDRFKRDRLAFVSFLCEKLGAEDLLEHALSGAKREKDGMFSSTLEENPDAKRPFDGATFISACLVCIKRFDPDHPRASFLAYFNTIYKQLLNKTKKQLSVGKDFPNIPKGTAAELRKISVYIQENFPEYTPTSLPERLYEKLAQAMGLSVKRIKELLRLIWMANDILLDAPSDGEDSSSPSLEIADPTPQELAENLERHLAVFAFLKELSKLEIHDYNQMFFSNLLLHPLHPQAGLPARCPGERTMPKSCWRSRRPSTPRFSTWNTCNLWAGEKTA